MSTSGPNYSATCADDATVGTAAWGTPTAAQGAADSVYTQTAKLGEISATLSYSSVKIVKAGTISGTDKSTGAALSTTARWDSFGSSSDLWGVAWTPSDINNSGFGVVVSITSNTPTVSHYLKATNFGFSIPGGATINGILAEFNIFANTLSTSLSFAKGTKIQTINGLKNIEDITKNDIVYAFDENKNVKPVKVNGTMSRIANDIVTINNNIVTTKNHEFYTQNGWKKAKELNLLDQLYHYHNGIWSLRPVELITFDENSQEVFNFEADQLHTYFANGYAVHNLIQPIGGVYGDLDSVRLTITYTGGSSPVKKVSMNGGMIRTMDGGVIA